MCLFCVYNFLHAMFFWKWALLLFFFIVLFLFNRSCCGMHQYVNIPTFVLLIPLVRSFLCKQYSYSLSKAENVLKEAISLKSYSDSLLTIRTWKNKMYVKWENCSNNKTKNILPTSNCTNNSFLMRGPLLISFLIIFDLCALIITSF